MDLKQVLVIHQVLIQEFGGSNGVRDNDLLDSALNRPYLTFDEQELYPTPAAKAAAILESIVTNHPFMDGNKRTGYTLMRLILMNHNHDIDASQDEKYQFVINVASGKMKFDEIKEWIDNRLIEK